MVSAWTILATLECQQFYSFYGICMDDFSYFRTLAVLLVLGICMEDFSYLFVNDLEMELLNNTDRLYQNLGLLMYADDTDELLSMLDTLFIYIQLNGT